MPYSMFYKVLPEEQQKDYNRLNARDQELIDQEYPRVYSKNGAMLSVPEDEYWLAKTIFWEAEDVRLPDKARRAVGHVARNRKEDPSPQWGTTYKDVVTQPGQFSPNITNDEKLREKLQNPLERQSWERAVKAARDVANAPDFNNPVPGIYHFHSPYGYESGIVEYQPWMLKKEIVTLEGVNPCDFEFFR